MIQMIYRHSFNFPFQGGQSVHLSDSKKLNKESLLNPHEELLFCLKKSIVFFFFMFSFLSRPQSTLSKTDTFGTGTSRPS